MTTFRDNGGKLPAGLTTIRNTTGRTINVSRYPGFFQRGGLIRTCIVWKNKTETIFDGFRNMLLPGLPWRWQCRLCNYQGSLPTWELAYATATHHAHNHHRS